ISRGQLQIFQWTSVTVIVHQTLALQPAPQSVQKEFILKIEAPERAVRNTGFRERAIQVQHSHQPRPLAAPVRDSKNRSLATDEPAQNVLGVLPDRFHYHYRRIFGDIAEDLQPITLAIDKAMAFFGVEGMSTAHAVAFPADGVHYRFFGLFLRIPADAVSGEAQVAVRNENDFRHGFSSTVLSGQAA